MNDQSQAKYIKTNKASLARLVRSVKLSQGQFTIILAHCNYFYLREIIVDWLPHNSEIEIDSITLPKSIRTLYSAILEHIED